MLVHKAQLDQSDHKDRRVVQATQDHRDHKELLVHKVHKARKDPKAMWGHKAQLVKEEFNLQPVDHRGHKDLKVM
jgi:hypothetical protein